MSNSFCSSGVRLYVLKDLGWYPSFNSILWSQVRCSGNRSAFFHWKHQDMHGKLLEFVVRGECHPSFHRVGDGILLRLMFLHLYKLCWVFVLPQCMRGWFRRCQGFGCGLGVLCLYWFARHQYTFFLYVTMCSLLYSSARTFHPPSETPVISNCHVPAPSLPSPPPFPMPQSNLPICPGPPIVNQSFFNVHDDSLLLLTHAKSHVTQTIQGGWAKSTLKRYTGTIKQFIRFCDAKWVPEHLRIPADEFVLCTFAASSFGRHAGGTPKSRLSARKAWHIAHNVEWKGSSKLRYVVNRVKNFAPGSSRRPPRPPVNGSMLIQLVNSLDLNSPLDAAVAACAVTAFWGQCWLGELLPPSPSSSPSSPLPRRSDFNISLKNPRSCLLCLPYINTHHHSQDIVLVDQCAPINPISLMSTSMVFSTTTSSSPLLRQMDVLSFLRSLFYVVATWFGRHSVTLASQVIVSALEGPPSYWSPALRWMSSRQWVVGPRSHFCATGAL